MQDRSEQQNVEREYLNSRCKSDSDVYEREERINEIASIISLLLEALNRYYGWFENDKEALQNTPKRIAKFYEEWFNDQCYNKWTYFESSANIEIAEQIFNLQQTALLDSASVIESNYRLDQIDFEQLQVVAVHNIRFESLCSHHMLPFIGYADVVYIPSNKVLGASKIPRIVRAIAHQPSIQEDLTRKIAESLAKLGDPLAVGVRLRDVEHTCMTIRGVKEPNSRMSSTQIIVNPKIQNAQIRRTIAKLVLKWLEQNV